MVMLLPQTDTVMKKIIVIAMLCMATMVMAAAQKTQMPTAAEKAFRLKFPEAKKVTWNRENKDEYEASFILNGEKVSANFSATGRWLETEMAIPLSVVPKAVMEAFVKQFPGGKVDRVYEISSPDGKIYYEIEYTLKGKKKEAKLSTAGTII